MKYIILRNLKKFQKILEECTQVDQSSPYQNPAFFNLYLNKIKFLSFLNLTFPFVLIFYVDDKPAVAFPLRKTLFSNKIEFLGDKQGLAYLDLILLDQVDEKFIDDCLGVFLNIFHKNKILLNRIKSNSYIYKSIEKIKINNISAVECASLYLPNSFEVYFKSLKQNVKQNFRTSNNRIVKDNRKVEFRSYVGGDIPAEVISQVLDLYLKRMKAYNKKYLFLRKIFHRYFDIGFESLKKLELSRLELIYIDGNLAGFAHVLLNMRQAFIPKLAIDIRYSKYSPGMMLIIKMISNLIAEKKSIYYIDFLTGKESYKYMVGASDEKFYHLNF